MLYVHIPLMLLFSGAKIEVFHQTTKLFVIFYLTQISQITQILFCLCHTEPKELREQSQARCTFGSDKLKRYSIKIDSDYSSDSCSGKRSVRGDGGIAAVVV